MYVCLCVVGDAETGIGFFSARRRRRLAFSPSCMPQLASSNPCHTAAVKAKRVTRSLGD